LKVKMEVEDSKLKKPSSKTIVIVAIPSLFFLNVILNIKRIY